MIRKILVGLSGPPYEKSAIHHSLELARLHGATVTGVTVFDSNTLQSLAPTPILVSPYARTAVEHQLEAARTRVQEADGEFLQACLVMHGRCEVRHETGEPFEAFLSCSRYHDLSILGLRGFFDYGLMPEPHDAVYKLFEQGVRPILAVSEYPRPVRRALIAYDGTMDSAKAMKRFVQMRLWPDLEIHIVCFERPEGETAKLLDEAVEYCAAHGYAARMHAGVGTFRRRLFPFADELNADIVVLGSAPGGLLERFLGGSLLWAIRHADRPLFLTH